MVILSVHLLDEVVEKLHEVSLRRDESVLCLIEVAVSEFVNKPQKDSEELVSKLIRGSENIDRMKREIDAVVKAIVGLIPFAVSEQSDMYNRLWEFYNYGYEWSVRFRDAGYEVRCRLLADDGEYSLIKGVSKFPEASKVKLIHNGLHVLLTGFMQFKAMKKHLAPFLDAADYEL